MQVDLNVGVELLGQHRHSSEGAFAHHIGRVWSKADVDTIVILSDGEPTVGPVTQPAMIRADVARWNEHRGIKIHTVSVGGSLEVLEWLAEDHGGKHVKHQ